MGEGTVREMGTDMYTLLYLKWIANKDLSYRTEMQPCSMLSNKLNGKRI